MLNKKMDKKPALKRKKIALMVIKKQVFAQVLKPIQEKRCIVLSDGKTCEAHYEACENHNDLHSKTLCENNIPKGHDKKCSWESNTCKTADRKCEDEVAVFTDTAANTETTPKSCYDLAHETNQRSIIFYSKDND